MDFWFGWYHLMNLTIPSKNAIMIAPHINNAICKGDNQKGEPLQRSGDKARDLLIKRKGGWPGYLLVNPFFQVERMGFWF